MIGWHPYDRLALQLGAPDKCCQPRERLKEFARRNGMESLDLLPLFTEHRDEKLFADADHFADRGHDLAAKAPTLKSRSFFDERFGK